MLPPGGAEAVSLWQLGVLGRGSLLPHTTSDLALPALLQIFGFLVCMGVILAFGNAIWEYKVGARFQMYLPWDTAVDSAAFSGFLSFWSYIIILNTVVPISLYVR